MGLMSGSLVCISPLLPLVRLPGESEDLQHIDGEDLSMARMFGHSNFQCREGRCMPNWLAYCYCILRAISVNPPDESDDDRNGHKKLVFPSELAETPSKYGPWSIHGNQSIGGRYTKIYQ
jgi:hypothetical protein